MAFIISLWTSNRAEHNTEPYPMQSPLVCAYSPCVCRLSSPLPPPSVVSPWDTVTPFFPLAFPRRLAHNGPWLSTPWVLHQFIPAAAASSTAANPQWPGSKLSPPCCRSWPLHWERNCGVHLLVGSTIGMSVEFAD